MSAEATRPGRQQEVIVGAGAHPGLDLDRVAPWFLESVPEAAGPLTFGLIGAGGSNLSYRVDDANGRRWILRRPPVGDIAASAHDVLREFKIIRALSGSPIPTPRCVATCEDPAVADAPLCVTEYVEGWIIRDCATAEAAGPEACEQAAYSMFDTLADLHQVDPLSVGLDQLSRPAGYFTRQLNRWQGRYLHSAGDAADPLGLDLHRRLSENPPADLPRASGYLVHGDYHIDNVIFDDAFSVDVVLDWELSTLGHPIADLAWAIMFWAEPGDVMPMMAEPVTASPGFPSRAQFAQRYATRSGFDLSELDLFLAFGYWKLGCLSHAVVSRSLEGSGGGLAASEATASFDERAMLERVRTQFELAASHAAAAGI